MKTRNAPLPDTVAELQAQLLAERRLVPERVKLIEQLRHKIEAGAEQLGISQLRIYHPLRNNKQIPLR